MTETRKKVLLFQPYLRKHILSFGRLLKNFEFFVERPTSGNFYKSQLPGTFEGEVNRIKTSHINKIRRFFGILNARIKIDTKHDILFTYGCLLLTNKPYCSYVENGVAIYNYDQKIAKNPIARLAFSLLIRLPQCKKIIFMSEAGKKSFFTTVSYSQSTLRILERKTAQIYPLIEPRATSPKKFTGELRLLFTGMFYIKGGIELINAFEKIRQNQRGRGVFLTIVTPFNVVKPSDIERMRQIPGLQLLDATLNESAMDELYRTHDIFMLPTYRDGFGLVLVEAIAWGLPIIGTDQYATSEVGKNGYNAMMYPNHPLKDYDPVTFTLLGKYYNPKDFYDELFTLQQHGKLKPIEDFIERSINCFIDDPTLLEQYSTHSIALYQDKFSAQKISDKIESIFLEALEK